MLILAIIVIGMSAGWVAHLIIERDRPLDWPRLFVAGLGGSLVGGTLLGLLAGDGLALRPAGILGSIIGAVLILALTTALSPPPAKPRRRQR